MREFTKSMMSYTWAMSLFGVQQMVNVFRPSKAVESFNNVTEATRDEFGEALRATFRAGDNVQRAAVDLTFGVLTLGMFNRGGASGAAQDYGQRSGDILRQGMRAAGQAADAVGQTMQGAASYTAAAAQQGAGRGGGAGSQWGQQAADAVGQGIRAMGQAADAVGQTVQGAAYATAAAAGAADDPRVTRGAGQSANTYSRADAAGGARRPAGTQTTGSAGQQTQQGWGPMPSQGSAGR